MSETETTVSGAETLNQARMLRELGLIDLDEASYETAWNSLSRARDIFRAHNAHEEAAQSLIELGNVLEAQGHTDRALEHYLSALRFFDSADLLQRASTTRMNAALMFARQGKYADAIHYFQQSIEQFTVLGDQLKVGAALSHLGTIYRQQGDTDLAIDTLQKAIDILHEGGARRDEVLAMGNLALVYENIGRYEDSIRLYEQTIARCEHLGVPRFVAIHEGNLGLVLAATGRRDEAQPCLERSIAGLQAIGAAREALIMKGNLGDLLADCGQREAARAVFEEVLGDPEALDPLAQAVFRGSLAAVIAEDDPQEALRLLSASEPALCGYPLELAKFLGKKARVMYSVGQDDIAEEALEQASVIVEQLKLPPNSEVRQRLRAARPRNP